MRKESQMLNLGNRALSSVEPAAGDLPPPFPTLQPPGYTGHPHFWQRALSRRQFVRTAAGATAMVVGSGLWMPSLVTAEGDDDHKPGHDNADPKPIPGGTDLFALLGQGHGPTFHFFFPAFGQEVSTVGDFDGFVAAAEIRGTGTAIDTASGKKTTLTFDADMRFMDGRYVAVDGHTRRQTFGFI
jgi:hypothetical protein